ncbi:MAG TPA: ATP-binding cassette domain-containing protein [Planctomycetota bacterium]|jgi:ABC-2 type transport system ATP-binding protein|nr:ATP-binding cassette domain-containing protein [Planctomycetota bacterium]
MDALLLKNLTKRFGDVLAVDGLSARIPSGVVYGLIGPNGSGKTTTIRMVLNIFAPDAGRVEVFGRPHDEAVKDRIGYLPEERGLYKKMRVRETLRYFAALKGMDPSQTDAAIERWLERFGLAEWGGHRVEALSKGMQQKVQFLATILHAPDLLVLDEPFSGLDPVNTNLLKDVLLEFKREGRTVLFSTHVMEVAEKVCDFVLMVHRGRKVLDGPLDAILREHGADSVVLEYEGNGEALRGIPEVASFNDYGKYVDVRLAPGADPQRLLRALVDRVAVRRFEAKRTSLNDIFLGKAGEPRA